MEFNSQQKRAIILTFIIVIIVLIIFIFISVAIVRKNNNKNNNIDVSLGYSSIKEIIEANECEYIGESYLNDREYQTVVELSFKYNLYTEDESNEDFYMKLINDVIKFIRYSNLMLIDKEKDITVEVKCLDGKIYSIVINGIEDYFIYMDSQLSLSRYKEIKTVNLNPTSEVLLSLNEIMWSNSIDCGTRDSIFQNYFIFFDEGIKYRKIGSKIFNIIFTENYIGEVIDNVSVGESNNSVRLKLGEPSFEDKDLGIIGYKGENFYAFFNGREISIYKNIIYDYSDFWELVNQFIDDDNNMSFKDFMNELTYIWPDYEEYIYDSNYMYISYPNKGIDIKLNYDNESGIIIYNNISEKLNKIQRYLENTEFISKLQIDNIFEAEKRRISNIEKLDNKCKTFMESQIERGNELINYYQSNLFDFYMDLNDNNIAITTYFISKDTNYANRELNEPVNSYVWINDYYFIYGVYNKGIYCYDVINGTILRLQEGNSNFLIKKIEDNIIYYDNQQIFISL